MKKFLLTLCVCLLGTITMTAQWSSNPLKNNRISVIGNEVWNHQFQIAPDGTIYVMYQTPIYDDPCEVIVHLQIMDIKGKKLFTEDEGKIISRKRSRSYVMVNEGLLVDKDGNAIIAISDSRNSPAEYQNLSYTLYKVSPTGEMLWSEDGLDLEDGETTDLEGFFKMIQLENGNYIVSWFGMGGTMLRCISPSGEILWKKDYLSGVYPYLCKAGNNEFIIVYSGGGISAKKFNANGEEIWKTTVFSGQLPSDVSNIPFYAVVKAFPDPDNGGVFVSWYDFRNDPKLPSPYVSYIKSDGDYGFVSGNQGERVGYTEGLGGYRPELYYDKEDNTLFACWIEKNANQNHFRLMGQKMAMTGELKWEETGAIVAPYSSTAIGYQSIQKAGNGQVAAFYMLEAAWVDVKAYMTLMNKADGQVTNVDADGHGMCFSSFACNKGDLESSPLTDNWYWVTMWKDKREIEGVTVDNRTYMQRINLDGSLGYKEKGPDGIAINEINNSQSLSVIPTLIDKQAEITLNIEETGKARVDVDSVSGQKVATIYDGVITQGMHTIVWNKEANIGSGIYIIRCQTKQDSKSTRVIVK